MFFHLVNIFLVTEPSNQWRENDDRQPITIVLLANQLFGVSDTLWHSIILNYKAFKTKQILSPVLPLTFSVFIFLLLSSFLFLILNSWTIHLKVCFPWLSFKMSVKSSNIKKSSSGPFVKISAHPGDWSLSQRLFEGTNPEIASFEQGDWTALRLKIKM